MILASSLGFQICHPLFEVQMKGKIEKDSLAVFITCLPNANYDEPFLEFGRYIRFDPQDHKGQHNAKNLKITNWFFLGTKVANKPKLMNLLL
jgi:hypothetical protein